MNSYEKSIHLAKQIRLTALELCFTKKASHIGGAYSIADVLAVLYEKHLNIDSQNPNDSSRDRLYYSKGHACTALYSVLHHKGFFAGLDLLSDFAADGSYFTSHVNHNLPGVELSTGSLGHALGVACGVAVASRRKQIGNTIVTILSDGELDEGSNWESFLFAQHHKLDNLIVIVDYNKIQSFGSVEHVMALEPLADKFRAFNWQVVDLDGHDHAQIDAALAAMKADRNGMPKVIIAHTIKGKGVSFMENTLAWHYKSPNASEYALAKQELETA